VHRRRRLVRDSASFDVTIIDDAPIAANDAASIGEDAVSVTGNALTNDNDGADDGATVTTPGTYVGTYGTLVLAADGSYTYTLKTDAATQAVIQGLSAGETLTDTFAYTMRDGDLDTSSANINVTILGANDIVTITGLTGNQATVDEDDLSDGTSPNAAALTQTGHVHSERARRDREHHHWHGHLHLCPACGKRDHQPSDRHAARPADHQWLQRHQCRWHGQLLLSAPGPGRQRPDLEQRQREHRRHRDRRRRLVRDRQLRRHHHRRCPDSGQRCGSIGEDAVSVTGNALTNDNDGADDGATVTTPGTYVGTYGTLVLAADGSYTYTLKTDAATQAVIQGLSAGETLTDTFAYTMRDGDLDTSSANINVTILGANDIVTITGLTGNQATVDEDDLSDGTSPNAAALTQTGHVHGDRARRDREHHHWHGDLHLCPACGKRDHQPSDRHAARPADHQWLQRHQCRWHGQLLLSAPGPGRQRPDLEQRQREHSRHRDRRRRLVRDRQLRRHHHRRCPDSGQRCVARSARMR
jgi:VCBS repeat-containing protein